MPYLSALRVLTVAALLAVLAACSSIAPPAPSGLSSGLTARMDSPGASVSQAESLGLINSYRATTGAPALTSDATLAASAQVLAAQYAASGSPPTLPAGATVIKLSAGSSTFANTFSGWRNSPADAPALLNATARRGGIGVAFNQTSDYGVYWVLLLGN